jgi:5,10-methylenetetrahydrofolate reductase
MAKEAFGELMKAIWAGKFVFTSEVAPMKTTSLDDAISSAKALKGYTVACNVTDNLRARAYLSSVVASHIVQERAGVEVVCQMTVRDRNRLALTSDLLGAAALGIKNILTMSGDHTTIGDNPGAMPVYDLDTAQFVYLVRKMVDEGTDLAGNKIDGKVRLHIGITGNPNSDPLEIELAKLERKVKLGAEFMQTQVVFDIEQAKSFLVEMKKFSIPIIVGIFPCKSFAMADYICKHVPGISVPKEYVEALRKAEEIEDIGLQKQRLDEVNLGFFTEFIKELRRTTQACGMHLMTIDYEKIVRAIIENVDPSIKDHR